MATRSREHGTASLPATTIKAIAGQRHAGRGSRRRQSHRRSGDLMRGAVASKGEARKPESHHHPSGCFGDSSRSKAGNAYPQWDFRYGRFTAGGKQIHSGCRNGWPDTDGQRTPLCPPRKGRRHHRFEKKTQKSNIPAWSAGKNCTFHRPPLCADVLGTCRELLWLRRPLEAVGRVQAFRLVGGRASRLGRPARQHGPFCQGASDIVLPEVAMHPSQVAAFQLVSFSRH